MLRIAELLEGACTGGQYVLFVPKESLVGEGRVPAKIGALKSEKLECVRVLSLLRMILDLGYKVRTCIRSLCVLSKKTDGPRLTASEIKRGLWRELREVPVFLVLNYL